MIFSTNIEAQPLFFEQKLLREGNFNCHEIFTRLSMRIYYSKLVRETMSRQRERERRMREKEEKRYSVKTEREN